MNKLNDVFQNSKKPDSNSFKRIITNFINLIHSNVILKPKRSIGVTLDKLNFPSWKDKLARELFDLFFTSLILTFILMAFTGWQWSHILTTFTKGVAISLIILVMLGLIKDVKEVVS